ncbi:MAG TPA: hypothetical protein VFS34_05735 [Thermoanaerobaculia bacterium]|nr:hypothetical protein [Thermoanaerobaculia bacterium]
MSLARTRLGIGMFVALAAAAGSAGAETPRPATARPIAPLAWLVGGTWTADASRLGPGMKRIETRYQWADNDAYIRFTTHFVSENGTLKNYDGNFFWNPELSTLFVWYMDARNDITQGPVTFDGDTMRITFRAPDFDGKTADMKVEVVRATNDLYTWKLAEKEGEGWKPLASLDYRRVAGS